jgi:NTE family protein
MKSYAGSCGYKLPAWATDALRERDITNRRYHQARRLSSYLDTETRPYIHLFDGGISDNLGVRPLLDVAFAEGGIWHELKAIDLTSTSKLAVIVVDAQHAIDNSFDKRDVALSLVQTVETASGVPLARYSFETLELLGVNMGRWQKSITAGRCGEKRGSASTGSSAPGDDCAARTYLAEVSFEAVPEKATRERLRALPTSLDLKSEDVVLLRKTARTVLENSSGFQELVQDLR